MSVLYSILPAQFLSFSAAAHANARVAEVPAIAAVRSFIKVLLFIGRVPGGGLAPLLLGDNPTIFCGPQEARLPVREDFLTVDMGGRCVRMCGATSRNITWHPHK